MAAGGLSLYDPPMRPTETDPDRDRSGELAHLLAESLADPRIRAAADAYAAALPYAPLTGPADRSVQYSTSTNSPR